MADVISVFRVVLNILPYDPRVYPLYFVSSYLYKLLPVKRSETTNASPWMKYFLKEHFRGRAIGSLSLLEKMKVPPFLSYLLDGVFIGDFTRFYTILYICNHGKQTT